MRQFNRYSEIIMWRFHSCEVHDMSYSSLWIYPCIVCKWFFIIERVGSDVWNSYYISISEFSGVQRYDSNFLDFHMRCVEFFTSSYRVLKLSNHKDILMWMKNHSNYYEYNWTKGCIEGSVHQWSDNNWWVYWASGTFIGKSCGVTIL